MKKQIADLKDSLFKKRNNKNIKEDMKYPSNLELKDNPVNSTNSKNNMSLQDK